MGADAPTARQSFRFSLASDVILIAISKQCLGAVRGFANPFAVIASKGKMGTRPLLRAQVRLHRIRKPWAVIEGELCSAGSHVRALHLAPNILGGMPARAGGRQPLNQMVSDPHELGDFLNSATNTGTSPVTIGARS